MSTEDYPFFDHDQRLNAIAATFDTFSQRYLTELGICAGSVCLEVGVGHGSVAKWMATEVGKTGSVVGTDVDERLLTRELPGVELMRHDIMTDPLPENKFDFIHSRFTLEWIPNKTGVLDKLFNALRPNGWLLVESDAGIVVPSSPSQRELFSQVRNAFYQYLTGPRGSFDPDFGPNLPSNMHIAGFEAIGAEGVSRMIRGGTAAARLYQFQLKALGKHVVEAGLILKQTLNEVWKVFDDPTFYTMSPLTVAAWGRKPTNATAKKPS